jgi:hypothetical protein
MEDGVGSVVNSKHVITKEGRKDGRWNAIIVGDIQYSIVRPAHQEGEKDINISKFKYHTQKVKIEWRSCRPGHFLGDEKHN